MELAERGDVAMKGKTVTTRRTFVKGIAGVLVPAMLAEQPLITGAEAVKRFWQLDRTHLSYGYTYSSLYGCGMALQELEQARNRNQVIYADLYLHNPSFRPRFSFGFHPTRELFVCHPAPGTSADQAFPDARTLKRLFGLSRFGGPLGHTRLDMRDGRQIDVRNIGPDTLEATVTEAHTGRHLATWSFAEWTAHP